MKKYILILTLFIAFVSYSQKVITMEKVGGTYKIPCKVNGIPMKFTFDTGASDVSISSVEAMFLIKQGLLTDNDIKENSKYSIANGDIIEGTKIILREISVDGFVLKNVEATIIHNQNASLLLGQSALSKLGKISIEGNKLIIHKGEDISDIKRDLTSFEKTKKNAETGDAIAQYRLGILYHNGTLSGKYINGYKKAVYWLKKSAEQGYIFGQDLLGDMYYYGKGMEKDYKKAVYWYQKSAEQGWSEAQYKLGGMYEYGKGTLRNPKKAFYWLKKSAEQEYAMAQWRIGYIYYAGTLKEKNLKKAFYWFRKNAMNGGLATATIGRMYFNGKGTEVDKKQAAYWIKKAYEEGDDGAKKFWEENKLWQFE